MAYPPGFEPDAPTYDTSGFTPDEPAKSTAPKKPDANLAETTTRLPQQSQNKASITPASKSFIDSVSSYIPQSVKDVYDYTSRPLIDFPSRVGKSISDYFDPTQYGNYDPRRYLSAYPEALGQVVSGLSSPQNLALTAATAGSGLAARTGFSDLSTGLRYAGGALSVPVAGHGAYEMFRPDAHIDERAMGAAELAGGALGMHGALSKVKPTIEPEVQSSLANSTQNILEIHQKADQIIKSGPEPLMKPEEVPAATDKMNTLIEKATSGNLSPQELIEGQQLDKNLREVNYGQTGEPGEPKLVLKAPDPQYPGNVRIVEEPSPSSPSPEEERQMPFDRRKSVTDYEQKLDELASQIPPEMMKTFNPDALQGLERSPNASGESAASGEAISRQEGMKNRGEKYVVYDKAGNKREIIGPEGVDYNPQSGETYGKETPRGFIKLTDNGGKVPEDVKIIKGRTKEYPGYKGQMGAETLPSTANEANDPFQKMLTGNNPVAAEPGSETTGISKPVKATDLLTKLANLSSKTTRTVLGTHIPGTALSVHGINEVVRHTLFGETYNPIGTTHRAVEAINMLARPDVANEYLKMNKVLASDAESAGVRLQTKDIGDRLFKGDNVLTKGFNYLTDPAPLFQQVIPALKVKSYGRLLENFKKSGMPIEGAKTSAAEAVNNIYGGLNLKALERNPTTQKVFRVFALAPDWMETNVRLGAGMYKGLTNPFNPAYKAYRVGAVNFLGAYTVMNIINAFNNDGKFMFQNDPGHELDMAFGTDKDGRVRYWRPFGTAMDMFRIPLELVHSVIRGDTKAISDIPRSRASEPIQFMTDMMSNSNWKGDPIFGRNRYGQQMGAGHQLYNFADDVMNHFAPAPVSSIISGALGKISPEEATARTLQLPVGYKKPEKEAKKDEKKWKY